ncbi:MAG TPA: hypothetical protein VGU65_06450 [Frateuria sp.]|uniref:hypothetical protein n=1 Tax=Frateuria sp. TaxID=2211372 RepID=UPI002DF52129|nr:hypothetical protein [Frateuria sp.]
MKQIIKGMPLIGPVATRLWRGIRPARPFSGSTDYWVSRYKAGGTSGDGSRNRLAEFKAEVVNGFVLSNGVEAVIEYGSGDGYQLGLANYPRYLGFDVSPKAVERCRKMFSGDATKRFKLVSEYAGETAPLTLSLDVIFHLVEDHVFDAYMRRLFDSSTRFVVIYSSNYDGEPDDAAQHVRHRMFSRWIDEHRPQWRLLAHVPNRYPYAGDTRTGSFCDFYIYGSQVQR